MANFRKYNQITARKNALARKMYNQTLLPKWNSSIYAEKAFIWEQKA